MWYYLFLLIPIALFIRSLIKRLKYDTMDKKVHTEFMSFIRKKSELEEILKLPISTEIAIKCEQLEAEANAHFNLYLKYLEERILKS